MRLVELVLLLLAAIVAGYAIYRGLQRYLGRSAPLLSSLQAVGTGWAATYAIDGSQTVWWIVRDVMIDGRKTRQRQEIARLDSAAADFDEQFRQAEQRANDRAFLLNSTPSG